jgi:hypothetical protein
MGNIRADLPCLLHDYMGTLMCKSAVCILHSFPIHSCFETPLFFPASRLCEMRKVFDKSRLEDVRAILVPEPFALPG